MNLDVIITGGWDRIGYNVLRSLSKAGLKVGFGVDKDSGMGVYSNIHPQVFEYISYNKDENLFIDNILNYIKITKPLAYLPTGEEVLIIAKHIKKFDNLEVNIPISPYNVLSKLHYKQESNQLAKLLGIPTPETTIPVSVEDIVEFGIKFGYPIVVKTFFSSSAKGVFFLQEKNLKDKLEKLFKSKKIIFGQFLIQQYVKGRGYGVSLLMQDGILRAKFTHMRLREKFSSGGPSTLREGTTNNLLERYAELLLGHVKFNGVAMVEFKYDEDENKGWFLEVNPRFWGSIALAINSGVDFPVLLYKSAINQKFSTVTSYRTGVKYKWLLGDIYVNFTNFFKSGRIELLKNLIEKVDGLDDLYSDDIKPFFASIFLIIKRNLKRIIWNH